MDEETNTNTPTTDTDVNTSEPVVEETNKEEKTEETTPVEPSA